MYLIKNKCLIIASLDCIPKNKELYIPRCNFISNRTTFNHLQSESPRMFVSPFVQDDHQKMKDQPKDLWLIRFCDRSKPLFRFETGRIGAHWTIAEKLLRADTASFQVLLHFVDQSLDEERMVVGCRTPPNALSSNLRRR